MAVNSSSLRRSSPHTALTSSVPTPHLDGKHVVFGKLRSNRSLVRRIESLPTVSDKPNEPVMISAAGVLSEDEIQSEEEAKRAAQDRVAGEDIWEDWPADEEGVDVEKPEECLGVAQKLKEVGTK
jgi:peptidyl-prolyl isomerase D